MAEKLKLSRKLFELAQKLSYFLTPDRQPYAQLPNNRNVPLHSEDFYTWLSTEAENKALGVSPAMLPSAIRKIDADIHGTDNRTKQVHLRTAPTGPQQYSIDLQSWDCAAIELTRKGWKLTQPGENLFLWPDSNQPYPKPEPSKETLIQTLQKSFKLAPESAKLLSTWLTAAMLPDQPCPVLLITGQARDAAARAIRTLLDPVTHPLLVLPRLESQFHKLALSNRVLAFSMGKKLSEGRREALAKLSIGVDAQLTQSSKRREPLQIHLRRPILIAAEKLIEIAPGQIHLEIHHAAQFGHAQTFSALLDELVKFLCTFKEPEELKAATSQMILALETEREGDPPDPPIP